MSKLGKILAVVGAALGVVIGLLLGGMVHKRPGKGRAGRVDAVHGGAISQADDTNQQLENELDGIAETGENITESIDSSTIHADSITDTNRDSLTGIRNIKDILATAKHRDDNNSDT